MNRQEIVRAYQGAGFGRMYFCHGPSKTYYMPACALVEIAGPKAAKARGIHPRTNHIVTPQLLEWLLQALLQRQQRTIEKYTPVIDMLMEDAL